MTGATESPHWISSLSLPKANAAVSPPYDWNMKRNDLRNVLVSWQLDNGMRK